MVNQHFENIISNKKNIFLRSWLSNNDPIYNIIIIHGLGEHSGRYKEFASFFIKKNIGVFSFDLIGHGKSDGLKGHISNIKDFTDSIEEVLIQVRKRFINTPIIIFGHSLGGCLALNYLIERKSKEISLAIISSAWIETEIQIPKYLLIIQKVIHILFPKVRLSNRLDTKDLSKDIKIIDKYKNDPLVHDRISLNLLSEINKTIEKIKNKDYNIEIPVLIIHGKKDKIISYKGSELISKKIKDSKLKLYDNVYHEPHNDNEKKEILEYYYDFIKNHKK
jgi:alpha-beta hydrolase superfamily lysophospholipase